MKDFAMILDWIRKDLNVNTMVLFVSNRNIMYTIHVPISAKVLSDHRTFMKNGARESKVAYVNGERVFGDYGIIMERGTEVWYHKRKMMDPAFQKKYLRCLMEDMKTITNKMCNVLEQKHDSNQKIVDIYSLLNKVALEIICTCGFSLREDFIMLEESELNKAVTDMLEIIPISLRESFTFWMPWKFNQEKKRLKEANSFLRGTVRKIFETRIKTNSENPDASPNDILDHIIRANTFSGNISIEDLLDDFVVFLAAGMETTAITMSCLIWHILKHPEISQKIVAEVNEVYGGKEELEFEDLNKLIYLEQCLKECLRLHPPIQLSFRRSPNREVIVDNLLIPRGTTIVMSTEAIQQLETHWPNPDKFDPERFTPGKKIQPFTYSPFSAGPRQCIGKHFAIMEAKVVLAALFQKFQLYDPYPEETKLEKVTNMTCKPKDGVFIGIEQ